MIKYLKITCIILFTILLCACTSKLENPEPDNHIVEFYTDFLHAFETGSYSDIAPFTHFEIPEYQQMVQENFVNIRNYKIDHWDKISDELWVATTYVETAYEPNGIICYHFVGSIENQLYVMIGYRQVPEILSGEKDLSEFSQSNAVDYQDLIPIQ